MSKIVAAAGLRVAGRRARALKGFSLALQGNVQAAAGGRARGRAAAKLACCRPSAVPRVDGMISGMFEGENGARNTSIGGLRRISADLAGSLLCI